MSASIFSLFENNNNELRAWIFYSHTVYVEHRDCIMCAVFTHKKSAYTGLVRCCSVYITGFGCWLQLFSPLCIYNYGSSGAVTTFVARDELPVSGHHAMMDLSAKFTQKCVLIFNIARPAPVIMRWCWRGLDAAPVYAHSKDQKSVDGSFRKI